MKIKVTRILICLSFILLFLVFINKYLSYSLWDYDFWWHISTGRYIVENHHLPESDPFSYATELEENKKKIGDLAKIEEDLLTYSLYPTTGEQFLKWKYNIEEKPDSVKPKTMEDVKREDELIEKARAEARG